MTDYAGPDAARSRLRATVAKLELDVSRLSATNDAATLRSTLADLVDQLALGPEPELRACPVCHQLVNRPATLCSNCWTKLTPPERAHE